jgi:hypothetical protein
LVASPFTVNKAYAELIYDRTSSPRLSKILRKWDEERRDAPEWRQKLAWVLLVELLLYQFASSVCWIETQDLFFEQYRFERFIEVGPSPTLAGMAVRTLKAKYEAKDDSTGQVRRIFCASEDQKEIYNQFQDESEATLEQDTPVEAANPAPAPVAAAPSVHAAPPATASPAASIGDVPVRAVDILAVIVSQKLKKQLSEVPFLNRSRSSQMASRRFKTKSWATCKASFHLHPTRVRSFHWRKLALPLDLAIPAISANIQLVSCCMQDVWWLQYFKCESSSLQNMGSGSPTRRCCATHCYYHGAAKCLGSEA